MDAEDLSILRAVLAGDRDAYAGLVRRYQARILRLCMALLKNAADAEDAAQEVFVKAYQSLSDFRENSAFYTWLYRIASNHCLDLLRSKSRRSAESLDSLLETEGDRVEKLFSSAPDPRGSFEAADLVEKILSGMKPDYRLVLTLREVEGLSYDEIGRVLDCSLDSVKARLRRAREEAEEKLRHFLHRPNV